MSKKLAEGLDALVLDVKWGSGAFMKTRELAHALARSMVDTGRRMHVPTTAIITDMNQPLGRMAGNAVEVNESVDALSGNGPADLMEVTLELGAELLVLTKREPSHTAALQRLAKAVTSGAGLEKLREMVAAQGGDLDAPRPVAPAQEVLSPRAGYVTAIDTEALGRVIIELGGGRKKLGDKLDHSTGLEMMVRLGDWVGSGQPLVRVFAKPQAAEGVKHELLAAIAIGDNRIEPPPLIAERIS
jgi:thymidine phosphorylase